MIDYEELHTSPKAVLKNLAQFLGIDDSFEFETGVLLNSRKNRSEPTRFYISAAITFDLTFILSN